MTPPRAKRGDPSLFAAAGLERDAPRPLADRLRPADIAENLLQQTVLGASRRCFALDDVDDFAVLEAVVRHARHNVLFIEIDGHDAAVYY